MHRLLLLCCFCTTLTALPDEVIQISWPSQHAAPAPQFASPTAEFLPAFRLAMAAFPESAIVTLALSQPAMLGLTNDQAAKLRPLVAARYELIAKSSAYSSVPSALSYCFAERRPQLGMALVHVPAGANSETPVMVFLHGYGGSFLWYQHLLAEHFSDRIIICPAYGINTSTISGEYVQECLQAAGVRLGRSLIKPALLGLSAGGFGACEIFTRHPERYARLICLAAYPPEDLLMRFPRDTPAAFMAGGVEYFVRSGDFARRLGKVSQLAPMTQSFTMPQADHFFMLTHTDAAVAKMREWLKPTSP